MKFFRITLVAIALITISVSSFGQSNVIQKFSLFYEYQKNNDYLTAYPYGWEVINENPADFIKYGIFKKMEKIIWALHDSSDTSAEDKALLADTALVFYDKAAEYEPDKAGYYLARKGLIMELWLEFDIMDIIAVYEEAVILDPNLDIFYQDRLGKLYLTMSYEDPVYKVIGLQHYGKLSQQFPDSPIPGEMMPKFAESKEDLANILQKIWEEDKENAEKAWAYADACQKAELYERAVIPLKFLTETYPEVINYWKQVAIIYQKLDQKDNAINAYKKLIELQPENRDAYINIAIIYQKLEQFSISRSYLQKASKASPDWEFPIIIEAQLYEQSARNCVSGQFDFIDKVVYKLAYDTYAKAAKMNGPQSPAAAERVNALKGTIPTQEDYFFRNLKSGDEIKIEGKCYDWIQRTVLVP